MPDVTKTARYALFRQLAADGLTDIFGNPGTSEQSLVDLLRYPEFSHFRYYLGLHEGPVVGMADAYARYRKRPVIVQLHSYAGLANGLGMMYYAKRGYTPLVVLVGEAGLRYEALDGQMAADLVRMAQPFVKCDSTGPCAWRVVDGESAVRLLRRAIKSAFTPPYGPTLLVLPMDVLEQENHEPIARTSLIDTRVSPSADAIAKASDLLLAASNPIILMGDGVAAAGAIEELITLAELVGAKVYGANDSEVNMPSSHPLYHGGTGHMFGQSSRRLLDGVDVALVAGTTTQPEVFPLREGEFGQDTKIIQFDLNTSEIAKNFPVEIAAVGNLKLTFAALASTINGKAGPDAIRRAKDRIQTQRDSKEKSTLERKQKDATLWRQVPLHAVGFMHILAERLSLDARKTLIFDEALTNSPELTRYLLPERPGTYFQTRAGMLGTGLPGAVGLKVAAPDCRVIGFAGDGGSISTIQVLNSAVRHKLGVKFVVCNNKSYRILKYNIQEYWVDWLGQDKDQPFPESFDLEASNLNFALLAKSLGVESLRVETLEQIRPAIDAMLADDDQPFLIELMLDKNL